MRKQFYEKVLPTQGVYCVTTIRNRHAANKFAETLDQVEKLIAEGEKDQANVFVAVNSFKVWQRTADNALFARSFYIDLDVGDSEKKYASQQEAVEALIKFVEDREIPPPIVVDSGGGIHAYWPFDEDIPIAEWKPYAKKFKALCLDHIKIDPPVTADAARIMRAPNTLNYKTDPPTKTSIITDIESLYQYSFKMFKDYLGPVDPELDDILNAATKGLDEDTLKLLKNENFEKSFELIAQKSFGLIEGEVGCNQIKYILEQAATLREPLWYAGLSIARHCADWESAIHFMSQDHPGYDREETIAKAEQTLNKPQGCGQFDSENPGGCDGCPHRGKIKNPLSLGRVFREAPTAENAVWKLEDPKAVPQFPESLKPYTRGLHGGIYYMPPVVRDEEGTPTQDPPLLIFKYDLYPIRRMFSPHDGECLEMRYDMPHDDNRDFLLPLSVQLMQDQLKAILPKYGASFDPTHALHAVRYIKKWSDYMAEAKVAEQMRMQMGWTETKDAFVIGSIEITPDGGTRPAPASPFVRNISKLLRPVGSYDEWQKAFNTLNEVGFEMHAFGGLIGFGSTLMHMTSTSGSVVSFCGDSGVAKTGALYACLSVWGQPKELSVFDATDNGMVGRYLGLHNLPLGCDEVSNKKPEQLSNLIHRISHGKAKIRMQASVNAEREIELSASLIALFTTNQPIYDKMASLKASPDGEMARIIEFTIRKPNPLLINPGRGKEIFDTFRFNYGWAGPEFVKYCYKIGEPQIKQLVEKWSRRFVLAFGADVAYRFYENTVASVFAAGELANAAGIVSIDLERIFAVVVAAMCRIRDQTPINSLDYKALVGDFVNRNQQNFLVLNEGRVISEPRGPLVGRTESDKKRRFVSKTEMRKFLSEYQVSIREFETVLKAEGMMFFHGKQRLSNGWKNGAETPPVAVYGFNYDIIDDSPE